MEGVLKAVEQILLDPKIDIVFMIELCGTPECREALNKLARRKIKTLHSKTVAQISQVT
jgi:hypothetical protein